MKWQAEMYTSYSEDKARNLVKLEEMEIAARWSFDQIICVSLPLHASPIICLSDEPASCCQQVFLSRVELGSDPSKRQARLTNLGVSAKIW
jgi:hypothetical protein